MMRKTPHINVTGAPAVGNAIAFQRAHSWGCNRSAGRMRTREPFDVIVVGARCAGSPLAALLARQGLRIAVVERATFPHDTLSTHIFQAEALAFLNRLGVMEKVRATGAPVVQHVQLRQEDFEIRTRIPQRPGDVGGAMSVRRPLLDPILAQAAVEAGAELRMGTTVTGLIKDGGRVVGVRVLHNGSQENLYARLVVGADGRNSTIAKLVGSRRYNVTPNERFIYWSFFEDADAGPAPAALFHRWAGRFVIASPSDSGLYQVIALPELGELGRFREDLEGTYMDYIRACAPVADALSGARRVGRLFGILRWEGFFREASGPGWLLVGDAGHFKDPALGQGIQDAFRHVDALAPAIVRGIEGSDQSLDRTLAHWGRWREKDAVEHYWLAADLGKAGLAPAVLPEVARRLSTRGKLDPFLDLFNHRSVPSKVLTPPRLLGATARLLVRSGCDRRALLREVGTLTAQDAKRKRLNRRPAYAGSDVALVAGATEIEEPGAEWREVNVSSCEAVVNGVRSPVLQAGPLDATEAVVFVHGNPGPGDDWNDLLRRVGEFGRAIAPDMPGYGNADKPRDFDYTISGYADHLGGLLEQLGIQRAHLVAHDFGGPWALAWAAAHPDAFASATLLNTGVLSEYTWHHYAKIWRTPILGELFQATATRPAFRLLLGRENPRLSRDAIDRVYDAARAWSTKRAVLKLYRATPANTLSAPTDALRALDRPALVAWGTADAYLPHEQAERQRHAFPSARVELLEGHGHWMMLEDPERVASLVVPFLRKQLTANKSERDATGQRHASPR